jgi:hypothetical protein
LLVDASDVNTALLARGGGALRLRARGRRPATVQVLLNAVNVNTAQIAEGHVEGAGGIVREGNGVSRVADF